MTPNSVANPNYFQIDLSKVKADVCILSCPNGYCHTHAFAQLTYPINNLDVGGGQKDNIDFKPHTDTTFNFPFTLTYNEADDPNKTVLQDILSRCGITGQKRDLDINYKITVRFPCICLRCALRMTSNSLLYYDFAAGNQSVFRDDFTII